MVFRVLLDPKAAKTLRKIDESNRERIKKALEEVARDPWKAGKPLHPSHFWGARSGDYRAIYEIDADQNQIIVIFIEHRKKVYDDFSQML